MARDHVQSSSEKWAGRGFGRWDCLLGTMAWLWVRKLVLVHFDRMRVFFLFLHGLFIVVGYHSEVDLSYAGNRVRGRLDFGVGGRGSTGSLHFQIRRFDDKDP